MTFLPIRSPLITISDEMDSKSQYTWPIAARAQQKTAVTA